MHSIACYESLALADDLGLARFFDASYCKQVIDDVTVGILGIYGTVINEIKARFVQFGECTFAFDDIAT
jgi:hypothetical protein